MSRKYLLDKDYIEKLPEFKLGIIEANVECYFASEQLQTEMKQFIEGTSQQKVEGISQFPEIAAGRSAYRTLGKDPTKYRLSAEKLLRRLSKGEGLDLINNIVDLSNLLSMTYRAPIGTFDADKIVGDIVLRAGKANESYLSLGNQSLNINGLPVFSDALGPFGSTTSDSARSCVDLTTKRIILTIFGFNTEFEMQKALDFAKTLIIRHAKGEVSQCILLEDKKRLHVQD